MENRKTQKVQEAENGPARRRHQGTDRFVANPDVSCRVEENEGAILFNPDTDNTTLINPTGLITWKFLGHPHTLAEAACNLASLCRDLPGEEAVIADIDAFISELIPEFILEVDAGAGNPPVP